MLSLVFLTLSLDLCDSPPHDLSSLSIPSSTGFGSLSVDFISYLPHGIQTFPKVKRNPLRKPLCHHRQAESPAQHTEKDPTADSQGLIHALILIRTHWALLACAVTDRILKTCLQDSSYTVSVSCPTLSTPQCPLELKLTSVTTSHHLCTKIWKTTTYEH